MSQTLAPKIEVRQVVLSSAGKLSTGTITPAATPFLPRNIMAADVTNVAAWTFSDNASVAFPVAGGLARPLPGSFVRDAIFSAGTYKICFYLDT